MPLPTPPEAGLERATHTMPDGQEVSIRALSRAEALLFADLETTADKDAFVIACSTDSTLEEVEAWFRKMPSDQVEGLSRRCAALSGWGPDAPTFRGSPS